MVTDPGQSNQYVIRMCVDGVTVEVPRATFRYCNVDESEESDWEEEEDVGDRIALRHGIAYSFSDEGSLQPRLFVSETRFDRNMALVIRGSKTARTVVFPGTVREAQNCAFCNRKKLRAVVLNEGLEALGKCQRGSSCGVFANT